MTGSFPEVQHLRDHPGDVRHPDDHDGRQFEWTDGPATPEAGSRSTLSLILAFELKGYLTARWATRGRGRHLIWSGF